MINPTFPARSVTVLAVVVSLAMIGGASPAHARASTGAHHVTLDYCQPIGPDTTMCEKVDILFNIVQTPSGIESQVTQVRDGVVNVYHEGQLVSSSYRSYQLHFLRKDGVEHEESFRSFFEVVSSDNTVFCAVLHNHYANGQWQFNRTENC